MFASVLVAELKLYGQFWLTDDRATVSPTQHKKNYIYCAQNVFQGFRLINLSFSVKIFMTKSF